MKKAVGYIRVSKEEQVRGGVSLDMQQSKIRAYADLEGMHLAEIIEDAGISGRNIKDRPGVQKVLSLVKDRRVGAVIVFKLDRLARNTVEALSMARLMDRKGVALHSISEKLDTKSAMGRFFFTLMASLAEMERRVISERTREALARKKELGERVSRFAPYGYRFVDNRLVEVPQEQAIVFGIKHLRDEGNSYGRIVQILADRGIKTRKGTLFHKSQIQKITQAAY